MPPQSHMDNAKKLNSTLPGWPKWVATNALRIEIDYVATIAVSQPPVMPLSNVGLSCCVVRVVKIV